MSSSMLHMENTEQRRSEIENGLEWSNGTAHFDQTGLTEKSGPPRKLNRTDPFIFTPKFPKLLVEWIAPLKRVGTIVDKQEESAPDSLENLKIICLCLLRTEFGWS